MALNGHGQGEVREGNDFNALSAGGSHSLALTSGKTLTLTIQTQPNGMNSVTPGIGEQYCYLGERIYLDALRCPKCPDVYQFDHWMGDVNVTVPCRAFVDMDEDKTITVVYVADNQQCGDECHPILEGYAAGDCHIDPEQNYSQYAYGESVNFKFGLCNWRFTF